MRALALVVMLIFSTHALAEVTPVPVETEVICKVNAMTDMPECDIMVYTARSAEKQAAAEQREMEMRKLFGGPSRQVTVPRDLMFNISIDLDAHSVSGNPIRAGYNQRVDKGRAVSLKEVSYQFVVASFDDSRRLVTEMATGKTLLIGYRSDSIISIELAQIKPGIVEAKKWLAAHRPKK